MWRKLLFFIGALALTAAGIAAVAFFLKAPERTGSAAADPRTTPLLVRVVNATSVTGVERAFTGTIAARVQSNLGFRVPGKIVERLVDVGQQVKAGQPLMRIDETDLRLALTAKRNAVAAARAVCRSGATRMNSDTPSCVSDGMGDPDSATSRRRPRWIRPRRNSPPPKPTRRVAENEATYSVLVADADGTVVETLGEPGQVVSAGQTVVRLAQAGPREAVVALPETIRPAIGSVAEASVYGGDGRRDTARLRQIIELRRCPDPHL